MYREVFFSKTLIAMVQTPFCPELLTQMATWNTFADPYMIERSLAMYNDKWNMASDLPFLLAFEAGRL